MVERSGREGLPALAAYPPPQSRYRKHITCLAQYCAYDLFTQGRDIDDVARPIGRYRCPVDPGSSFRNSSNGQKGGAKRPPNLVRGLSLGSLVMRTPRRSWSESDVAKLREMAQKFPAAQIAIELGRGLSGAFVKAHQPRLSLRVRTKRGSREAIDPGPAGFLLD
jgi:hypothetical protein